MHGIRSSGISNVSSLTLVSAAIVGSEPCKVDAYESNADEEGRMLWSGLFGYGIDQTMMSTRAGARAGARVMQ